MIGRLFWFWYAVGLGLMLLYQVPDFLAFSNGLFLLFYAAYALSIALPASNGIRKSTWLWFAGLVALFTYGIEYIGVQTGYPFGDYEYTPLLGVSPLGVPLAVSCAWVGVMINGILLSRATSRLWRALEVGFWALWFDLVLDPVAAVRGFWVWEESGWYQGIPTQNFVGWFAVAALLSLFFPLTEPASAVQSKAVRLYLMMLLMFGLLAAKAALWLPLLIALIGCLLVGRRMFDDQKQQASVV